MSFRLSDVYICNIFLNAESVSSMFEEIVLLTFVSCFWFSPMPEHAPQRALSVTGGLCPPVLGPGLSLLKLWGFLLILSFTVSRSAFFKFIFIIIDLKLLLKPKPCMT